LWDGRASERIVKIFAADTSAGSVQVYTDRHGSDKKKVKLGLKSVKIREDQWQKMDGDLC